eukprot:8136171-Prorocentrum_lima.AAC.1
MRIIAQGCAHPLAPDDRAQTPRNIAEPVRGNAACSRGGPGRMRKACPAVTPNSPVPYALEDKPSPHMK